MEPLGHRRPVLTVPSLDDERSLVRSAVSLVAAGRSRRVVVAGLRHGNALLPGIRDAVRDLPIVIEVLERVDDAGPDLAIVRIDAGGPA